MKKVNFLSGLSAIALAAMCVVGLSLTSCEEEDLTVADTNITVTTPDVTVTVEGTEVTETQGVVYLTVTATNTSGVSLTGVTFTVTGSDTGTYTNVVSLTLTESGTFGVTAQKSGYVDGYTVISTPDPVAGTLVIYPVTMVLQTEEEAAAEEGSGDEETQSEETVVTVEEEELTESEIEEILVESETTATETTGSFDEGETITVTVSTPDATAYLTEEQKSDVLAAIEALTGPTSASAATRADDSNLTLAKVYLKAKLANIPSAPNYNDVTYTITFTEAASAYTIVVTNYTYTQGFTLAATIDGSVYAVDGKWTVTYKSSISHSATGVETSHDSHDSHDSHGTDSNAGGGTTSE